MIKLMIRHTKYASEESCMVEQGKVGLTQKHVYSIGWPMSTGSSSPHFPTSDEHPLRTASSVTTEVLEPTSVVPIPQPNLDKVAGTPNKIKEVPSTLEVNDRGLRNAHIKEESGM